MKKRIAVPMLILIVICTLVLADDSYEPYLHRADVAQGPELSELGSYSTDSYSGSASYTIEIDVPSGRNGLQPVLGLNYNSHITKSKPTVFGTGWSMTESYILRDVNHTVTDQSDDEYRLSLFGRGYKLVYNGTWNTKVDQNLKIQNYSEYWTVNTPEGSLYRLGYNDDSKLESNQDDFVVKWYLDTINDTHDDIIGYSYLQNPVVGDNGSIYLDEITYTHNKIKFNYEQRPDIWTSFNNGITEVMSWIVSDISVFSDDDLVRRYGISYIHQTDSRTMIEQVSVYGLDNTTISYRTNFTYEIPKAGWTSNSTWDPPMVFVTSTGGDKGARFVDVNGDGLPDVIQSAYGIGSAAYINTGNGWVSNSTWNPPILFIEESQRDQGTRIADVNGDGLPDIIQRAYGYGSSAYINTGSGWTSNSTWNPPIEFLNSDGDDKGTRVADVNGDGFPDFIQNAYGQGSSAYMNTGSGWVSNSSWVPPVEFITEYGRDKGTRIVDVNGDGLPDIIQEAYGLGDSAYLNTGNGWIRNDSFDPPIEFLSSTGGDKGTRLADVNGDGLPDIIQSKYGEGSSAYMNTGTGWSRNDSFQPPIEFIDSSGQNKGTRLADVNGDGLVDIIQSKYGGGSSAYTQKGSHNHYLIKAVTTYGGETVLSYLPSTSIDNTGSDEISDLSYNMWLVQNETIYNGMDTISSTIYNYSGGLFDYEDREFRGFAYSIGEKADGSTIEHYYHQSDALQGKEYKTEIKNSSGDLYLRSENYWSYEDGDYFIVELDGSATSQYDGTNNPKVTNTSYTYDDYGNVLTIDYSGIKSEVYEYVYNLNDWVVDKVKHYQLKDTNVIAESWYAYDNQSNGTAPSKGDLTQKVDYLNTGTNPVTSYNYDSFGNLIWETDPNGETTYYVYGLNDTTYTFPEQVINPKGHIFETRYDLGTGNILWKKDPNNVYTNYSYDVFGRIIKEIRPYDSSSLPTTEYEYSLDGTAPEKVVVKNGDVNVSYFYDGFGQIMQAKTSSENGQAVTDYYFDENMRVSAVSNPYFVSYSNSYTTPAGTEFLNYTYDVLDRVVVVNNLDSTEKKIEFSVYNITAYDENDNKKKYTVDELDKITSVFEYLDDIEYETTYEYDVLGNVISITDSLNNEFVFTFDSLSRKTGIDDPDLGVWNYSYDSNGNLITQLDARGEVVSLGYDSINRLIEKNSSEDSIDYSYDTVIGTLSSVSGNFGSISFDYDDRLRLTGRDITLDGTTFNTHYSYDSQDRISSKTLHDGTVIDYTYDKQGLLDSIGSVVDNIDYTAAGLKTLISYGNGLDSEYSYSYNRLSRLKTSSLQDLNYEYDSVGNILEINNKINSKNRSMTYDDLDRLITADYTDYDMTYSYNIIGNMISVDGTKDAEYSYDSGPVHAPSSAKLGNRFVFKDSSGDVTAVFGDDGNIYLAGTLYENSSQSLSANDEFVIKNDGDEVFILDSETGNLYIDEVIHENQGSISQDSSQNEFIVKDHNADIVLLVNESGSVFSIGEVFESHTAFETLNYDANGNLIQDNTQYYEYNAFNQLERVREQSSTGNVIEEYEYDQDGQRVMKTVVGSTGNQTYYYVDKDFVRITNLSGNYDTVYYYLGTNLIGKNSSGTISYMHPDHLGSTSLVTNSAGTEEETVEYYPFGETLSSTSQDFTYESKELDGTNLQYFEARYKGKHHFTQPDTLLPDIYDPQQLNRYMFERGNPYKFVDESGHDVTIANYYDVSIFNKKDGHQVLIIGEENDYKLYSYTSNDGGSLSPDPIEATSPEDAVGQFNNQYPDTKLNIVTTYVTNSEQTAKLHENALENSLNQYSRSNYNCQDYSYDTMKESGISFEQNNLERTFPIINNFGLQFSSLHF